ncbi:hybrid sensor histidine kinase/response regulator [Desulfuromonas acetoxidans]|uniref:histidine kinase n=1 Tax=Desulfuromonas acetoxidans (strain DSM 684 / 11070) TaxID=281689 RepID=Q1JVS2_DESA6|nr:hybrid sensor histidine kinase/response regulator [Desulfuromonas acetoxidans]EAT14332.1 CheA signal transduction histidine kinases [Desulfuromonas acetoxidans DSM 684]MBF0646775.1 response regulator [Desulfuromonas acetoxidans]NVD24456.1 response regulator [Desulfuromonas acetoxidans]
MAISESAKSIFFEEADEHLTILESGLLEMEQRGAQQVEASLVDKLFRSAHTLKGASALLKFNSISEISHELENLLENFKAGSIVPSDLLLDAMLASLDSMRNLLQITHLPDYRETAAASAERACRSLQAAQAGDYEEVAIAELEEAPAQQLSNSVKVGVDKIDQMMNLLGEMTITKTHLLEQLGSVEAMKEEIDFARERLLREVTAFSERYEYTNPEEKGDEGSSESTISDFDELEFDRYDELNLFSRKLQEISNDINEAVISIRSFFGQVSVDVEAIDRMTSEMKERISEIRTLPVDHLYQRFRRSMRNLSKDNNKQVDLVLEGGDTRLGRTIIDGLFDPLLHVLRNAVAHGLESPEERKSLGKPITGTIKIATRRSGSTATITISDDGRGIQVEKVRSKAIRLGWITEEDKLDRKDLIDLIFRPGFSTKEEADDTSGRGVGMDVVLDRLSALNGTVDVRTTAGEGTEFVLQIPLSLIIINVIQFRLGNQFFILPSALIEEIQEVTSLEIVDNRAVRQDENYQVVDLNQRFSIPVTDASRQSVLFVRTLGSRLGLMVEEIISQEDTVIRPFGAMLAEMPCFSGTSVSGGGDVRLAINPTRLSQVLESAQPIDVPEPVEGAGAKSASARVLVVDDSLSIRKYASMILEANGVEVLLATNGHEALEVLEDEKVDMILTDLEMPVMHGYELLSELNRRENLRMIPTVVITSRSGGHHQEKAFKLGASDYLVKPFDEESLIRMIREYTLCSI